MNVTFRSGVATPTPQTNQPNPADEKSTNVTTTLNPKKDGTSALVDKNYASLQIRPMKVAFKGLPAPLPKGPTLGEKINGLFEILKTNEVILIGKNFKNAMKDFENHINNIDKTNKNTYSPFKKVIKKIFFVEDKAINHTMGFSKNQGRKEYTNLGQDMNFVLDKEQKSKFFIKPNETIYISPNDTLQTYDGVKIDFKNTSQLSPNKIKTEYAMVVDKTKEAEEKIQEINKKTLKQLTVPPKPVPKRITFKDVGGMDETVREMKELIVHPINHPELRSKKNMNKSILLEGPPGTGKSLLAEAAANESNAYFVHIKGSELDSKYVGESEKNVRNVVNAARENQPAIIFIDEVDAIAKARNGKDIYGEKVLNTWLAEMSESEKRGDDIYYIAATNNVKSLDKAMTRAGRFGNVIHVGEPDEKGVKQIFDIHKKDMPLAEDFNEDKYIKELHKRKAVGADIASAIEDAERFAKRRERIFEKIEEGTYHPDDMKNLRIKNEDFDKAIEGVEKRKALEKNKAAIGQIGFNADRYKTTER